MAAKKSKAGRIGGRVAGGAKNARISRAISRAGGGPAAMKKAGKGRKGSGAKGGGGGGGGG